ncbi:MAG: efflux RND transporter periplasmic adaptor subunit [Candidatus Sumerlaeota bacterium]|nr:efflux RND transporter periplasmic adaptor subunit [Candidatus Sumerlaeota bacterium]
MRPGLKLTVLFIVAASFFGGCARNGKELVVSGRIEVDKVRVGSKIGGRVWKVHYDEGDAVKSGEPVVQLEDRELKAQLDEASASLAQAQSQLDLLLVGSRREDIDRAEALVRAQRAQLQLSRKGFRDEEIRQAEAQLVSAKSELDLAKKELDSAEMLRKSGTIEQREYDKKRNAYETARAQADVATQKEALYKSGSRPEEIAMSEARLAQAQAELERLKNGARPEEIAAQRAAVEAAAANLARIDSQLAETRILAPMDSTVETLDLKPGDLVKAGETVSVLNLRNSPWVRCYVPENRLGLVRTGMDVDVTVDSFPGKRFKARVRRVNSEAEFTPRNVQTTEKRSELVFEMKADVLQDGGQLRAGMYADVHVPIGTVK